MELEIHTCAERAFMRDAFVKAVIGGMECDQRIVLLLGDIGVNAFKEAFERWPDRCFNVGICEQSMVSMAAGMARAGLFPVVHTIAPFLVLRALEQIKIDFGYQRLPGLFVSVGASFDYAALGCTHHCPEDVEVMKTIPDMRVYAPWDSEDAGSVIRTCLNSITVTKPHGILNLSYVRLAEDEGTMAGGAVLGRRPIQMRGRRATVVTVGTMLPITLRAVGSMGVNILHYTKVAPFDTEDLSQCALAAYKEQGKIKILLVEPYYWGGLAREILNTFSGFDVQLSMVGVARRFSTNYGTRQQHLKAHGLTEDVIREKLELLLA